jgi:hypothetical protein
MYRQALSVVVEYSMVYGTIVAFIRALAYAANVVSC